jgi:hypothetical protein
MTSLARSTQRIAFAVGLELAVILATGPTAAQDAVPREACLPFESLPADLRREAEALLLKALDTEGLYTLVAGLKPVSSGVAALRYPPDAVPHDEIARLRRIFATWRCGNGLAAAVHEFTPEYPDGLRYTEAVIFNVAAVRDTVSAHPGAFASIPRAHALSPAALLDAVDHLPRVARVRAFGHLYGYPAYAVRFFAEAEAAQAADGRRRDRAFLSVPTFDPPLQQYVYAVPADHRIGDEDRALRARAAPVLAAYRARRGRAIGPRGPGALALLRDWYDDGRGRLAVAHATADAVPFEVR